MLESLNASAATTEEQELTEFLSDYVCEILAAGATSARADINMHRIAKSFGCDVDLAIFNKHIVLTVNGRSVVGKIPARGLSFYRNTELSRLSWHIADNKLTMGQAQWAFRQVVEHPDLNPWIVLLLTSLANMSFCEIFGGDFWAMAVVFFATAVGYTVKIELMRRHFDHRMVFILSAFCATVTASMAFVYNLGNTPDVALGTSVLYLVPGIPFINSISDLIHGHNMCFMSRLINATVLTLSLSIGFILGLLVMHINLLS